MEPIIKFDSFDFEKGFSSSVDIANRGILACKILFSGIIN